MKVALLILNYNGEEIIEQCVDAALAQDGDHDIYVIDNGSFDNSWNILQKYTNIISLKRNHVNKSFSKAYNEVYEKLYEAYDIVGIVSNDVFMHETNLILMIANIFIQDVNIGQVAPKSIRPDGSLDLIAKNEYNYNNLVTSFKLNKSNKIKTLDQIESKVCSVLQDSCVFIRTKALNDQLYNENLQFYFTEDYLSKIIEKKGYINYYYAEKSVRHLVSFSTEKRNMAESYKLQYFDALRFCKIFFPKRTWMFKWETITTFLIKYIVYKFR